MKLLHSSVWILCLLLAGHSSLHAGEDEDEKPKTRYTVAFTVGPQIGIRYLAGFEDLQTTENTKYPMFSFGIDGVYYFKNRLSLGLSVNQSSGSRYLSRSFSFPQLGFRYDPEISTSSSYDRTQVGINVGYQIAEPLRAYVGLSYMDIVSGTSSGFSSYGTYASNGTSEVEVGSYFTFGPDPFRADGLGVNLGLTVMGNKGRFGTFYGGIRADVPTFWAPPQVLQYYIKVDNNTSSYYYFVKSRDWALTFTIGYQIFKRNYPKKKVSQSTFEGPYHN